jgi:hypothetical protein
MRDVKFGIRTAAGLASGLALACGSGCHAEQAEVSYCGDEADTGCLDPIEGIWKLVRAPIHLGGCEDPCSGHHTYSCSCSGIWSVRLSVPDDFGGTIKVTRQTFGRMYPSSFVEASFQAPISSSGWRAYQIDASRAFNTTLDCELDDALTPLRCVDEDQANWIFGMVHHGLSS